MIFSQEEEIRIVEAIREAERGTSGEIRLFVEPFCMTDHPVERAQEVFQLYGMFHTKERNAILVYIAEKSRQFAFWGDAGIHEKVGFQFWEAEKSLFRTFLQRDAAAEGAVQLIALLGEQLRKHFPADLAHDDNELSNDIIYG
jgi:uncharacterized membrane protein